MRAAVEGRGVEVYGDGLQRRDLVHVGDVARAFASAVLDWPSGPTIIGAGTSHTVLDLVEAARQATGRPIAVEHVPAKPGEMPAVVVDVSRAAGLGWAPEVDLVDGVRSAWADFAPAATT
jgi:UDP-glucose 4-epimerase